jgi:Tfp pilus assembly protein PilO
MDFKMKIVCAVAPFGIAAAVGFSLLQPAFQDYNEKAQNVETRKHDSEELTTKLADRGKIMKEKAELEAAINSLRGSVPKDPALEILDIDLEKMALESGLNLISITTPNKDTLKKAGLADDSSEPTTLGQTMAKNKAALADKVKSAAAPASAAAAAIAGSAKTAAAGSVPPDAGLSKNILQVKLMGSYNNLMTFTHKLETYQHVLAVSDLHVSLPKGHQGVAALGAQNTMAQKTLQDDMDLNETDAAGDPDSLNVALMITSYYLP